MQIQQTLLLGSAEVSAYLPMGACIEAVERAFRLLGEGEAEPPVAAGVHAPAGGFHVKAGMLKVGRRYFAAKVNGNFPSNPASRGLPTIQGLVMLCDGEDGRVLAVMDSMTITARRTAAATAVAAKHLAPPDARVAAICGCGVQARAQLEAIVAVLPIESIAAVDQDATRARHFAAEMQEALSIRTVPVGLEEAVGMEPDVWITCTTSTDFFLHPEHVRAGAFVAGVGVDASHKRELAPALVARSHLVCDSVEQCRSMGDLHHALAAGSPPVSTAELSEIVAGRSSTRAPGAAVHIFDSTGLGIQDVAAAAAAFERAEQALAGGAAIASFAFGRGL